MHQQQMYLAFLLTGQMWVKLHQGSSAISPVPVTLYSCLCLRQYLPAETESTCCSISMFFVLFVVSCSVFGANCSRREIDNTNYNLFTGHSRCQVSQLCIDLMFFCKFASLPWILFCSIYGHYLLPAAHEQALFLRQLCMFVSIFYMHTYICYEDYEETA